MVFLVHFLPYLIQKHFLFLRGLHLPEMLGWDNNILERVQSDQQWWWWPDDSNNNPITLGFSGCHIGANINNNKFGNCHCKTLWLCIHKTKRDQQCHLLSQDRQLPTECAMWQRRQLCWRLRSPWSVSLSLCYLFGRSQDLWSWPERYRSSVSKCRVVPSNKLT